MNTKKTAKSWLILGVVLIALLFVYAGLTSSGIITGSAGTESLVSAICGFAGILFLIIGTIKWFIERRIN